MLERQNRELKRRTRVATLFPNEASLLRLVTAVLVELSDEWETGKINISSSKKNTSETDLMNLQKRCCFILHSHCFSFPLSLFNRVVVYALGTILFVRDRCLVVGCFVGVVWGAVDFDLALCPGPSLDGDFCSILCGRLSDF